MNTKTTKLFIILTPLLFFTACSSTIPNSQTGQNNQQENETQTEEKTSSTTPEYNDPEILKYAKCFNTIAASHEVATMWWDCNSYVNRNECKENVEGWAKTITQCFSDEKFQQGTKPDSIFTEESAKQAVLNMQAGWNLGNTLDSTSQCYKNTDYYDNGQLITDITDWVCVRKDNDKYYKEDGWIIKWGEKDSDGDIKTSAWEKAWNEPVTTKEMIEFVHSLGFKTVRVPVTWGEHLDENNQVNKKWMARVKEVVDYVVDSGMYCVLNVHHDGGSDGWIKACESSYTQFSDRFGILWTQIAETFKDYDEHLLFESMNEVLNEEKKWDHPSTEDMEWIFKWNQLYVDSVRKTGGNNAKRNLIIMGYAGDSTDSSLKNLVLPVDSVENHLIVEIHNYNPWSFTSSDATWTKMTAIYTDFVEKTLTSNFDVLQKYQDKLGVPFVVGEYAAFRKKYADFDK